MIMESYNNFKTILEQSGERERELNDAIQAGEANLAELNADYKAAVLQDDDIVADELFNAIEVANGTLKNDKRKLSVLNQYGSAEKVIEAATKVWDEGRAKQKSIQLEVNEKLEEFRQAKQAMFDKLEEVGRIQYGDAPIINMINDAIDHIPTDIRKQKYDGYLTAAGDYVRTSSYDGSVRTNINAGQLINAIGNGLEKAAIEAKEAK